MHTRQPSPPPPPAHAPHVRAAARAPGTHGRVASLRPKQTAALSHASAAAATSASTAPRSTVATTAATGGAAARPVAAATVSSRRGALAKATLVAAGSPSTLQVREQGWNGAMREPEDGRATPPTPTLVASASAGSGSASRRGSIKSVVAQEYKEAELSWLQPPLLSSHPPLLPAYESLPIARIASARASAAPPDSLGSSLSDPSAAASTPASLTSARQAHAAAIAGHRPSDIRASARDSVARSNAAGGRRAAPAAAARSSLDSLPAAAAASVPGMGPQPVPPASVFPVMSPLSGRSSMHLPRNSSSQQQHHSPAARRATGSSTAIETPLPFESKFVDNFSPASVSGAGADATSSRSPASVAEAIAMHGSNGRYAYIPSRPSVGSPRSLDALLADPLSPSAQHALFDAGGVACFARLVDLRKQRCGDGAAADSWKDLSEVRTELARLRAQQEAVCTPYRTVEQLRIPLEMQEAVLRLLTSQSCPLLSPRPAAELRLADLAPLFAASGAATLSILEQLASSLPAPCFPSLDGLAQALGSFTLRAGLHLLLLQRMLLPEAASTTLAGTRGGIELAQEWFEQGLALLPSRAPAAADSAVLAASDAANNDTAPTEIVRGPAIVSLLQGFAQSQLTLASVEDLHAAMQRAVVPAVYHSPRGLSPRKPLNRSFSVASTMAIAQQQLLDLFNSAPTASAPTLLPRTNKLGAALAPVTLSTPQLQQLLQILGGPEVALLYLREIVRVRQSLITSPATEAGAPSSSATEAGVSFFKSWSSLIRMCRRLKLREAALRSFLASPTECTILPPPPVGFNSTATSSTLSPRSAMTRSIRPMDVAQLALVGVEDAIISAAAGPTKPALTASKINTSASAGAASATSIDSDSEDSGASVSVDESHPRPMGASSSQQNLAAMAPPSSNGVTVAAASASSQQASQRWAFLRSNPLIAVVHSLQRDGRCELVPDVAALTTKVRKQYAALREQRAREAQRLTEILEASKGVLLVPQLQLEGTEIERLHAEHADVFAAAALAPTDGAAHAARSAFDTLLSRIDALLPSSPRFASLSALDSALCAAREDFEAARRDLYTYLHSPACPLWPAKGGGKLVYAECSYATIDALLAAVGPLPSNVREFSSTLVESKTRCASAAVLLDLAREHTEVKLAISNRRQNVARMTREFFLAFLVADPGTAAIFKQQGFANERDQQAYATLSAEQRQHAPAAYSRQVIARLSAPDDDAAAAEVNLFLADAGVKHTTAAWAAPQSEGSVQTLCALVKHLLYQGRNYEGLNEAFRSDLLAQAAKLKAEKRAALKFIQAASGALSASAAGMGQSGSKTNLSLSLGLTMKASTSRSSLALGLSQPNTPRAAAGAAIGAAGGSPSSPLCSSDDSGLPFVDLVQPSVALAWTLADMDTLFHTSGSASVNSGRVLRDLHALQQIAATSPEDGGKSSAEPFESLASLAAAIAAHHSSVFLPVRRAMHSRLLAALGPESHSVLLGSDAVCSVDELDELLDRTVVARAMHLAKTGAWADLHPSTAHLEWIATEARMPLDQIADSALAQWVSLQAVLFFEMLQTLALLEEGQNISCESVAELGEEVVAFHSEQRAILAAYLHQRADDIFDPAAVSSALDFTDASSADTLDSILRGFAGQAFLCTRFLDSLLAKARSRAQRQEALAREAMKAHALKDDSSAAAPLGMHNGGVTSFSATMHQTIAVFRRCSSLQALHSQLCTLQNQSASALRKLQDKLGELGLLHDPNIAFTEPDASELFNILAAVPPEKQMDVAAGLMQTLAQRAADALVEAEVMSSHAAAPPESGSSPATYASVVELLETLRELVTEELDGLCSYLAEDASVARMLSERLLASLAEESEALERMWVAVDGVWARVRNWVQSALGAKDGARTEESSKPKLVIVQTMPQLLDQLHAANDEQMEQELALKSFLYSNAILAAASDSSAAPSSLSASPPNRVSLRKIIRLCEELGQPDASSQQQFLQSVPKNHHAGKPFASLHDLQRALFRLVSAERLEQARLAAEAAERARIAAEAELARQRAEEEAAAARALAILEAAKAAERALVARRDGIAALRSYILSAECSLFPKSRRVMQLELAATDLKKKDALGPGEAVLAPLFSAAREDLPSAVRTLDALQSLHQTFQYPSSPELLAAFSAQVARFDASCAEIVAWFTSPAAAAVLSGEVCKLWSAGKEGLELMEAFDKEAQMGAEQVQRLAETVAQVAIEGRAASAAAAAPAFSSLASLLSSMRAHRAAEFASLESWLGTSSAETLFLKPEELEASVGSLLRLLLAAKSWVAVRQALRTFQAQSRQFDSLESLAAAVTAQQASREREEAAVLDWLESGSGVLLHPGSLSPPELSLFRAHLLAEGVSRVQNELITLQQDCIAGVGPSAGYSPTDLLMALRARSAHATQSLRDWMGRGDGGKKFYTPRPLRDDGSTVQPLAEADYASLLDAVIDPSLLAEALQTLHASFVDFDMLLLAVRRFVHARWNVHVCLQRAAEKHAVLAAVPQAPRTLMLSFFDSTFLLSLMPDPVQIEGLFAKDAFKSKRFASIEALVEEVQRVVEGGAVAGTSLAVPVSSSF